MVNEEQLQADLAHENAERAVFSTLSILLNLQKRDKEAAKKDQIGEMREHLMKVLESSLIRTLNDGEGCECEGSSLDPKDVIGLMDWIREDEFPVALAIGASSYAWRMIAEAEISVGKLPQ